MRLEHWFYTVPLRLRSLFRRRQVEQELDEELQYHLERKIEENITRGLTPEEARYAAIRSMEGLDQQKEKCRDLRKVNFIQDLVQDFRFGLRMLRKSPAFTAIVVFTLALGIGANTAIFSIVNTVLLRPLPFRDSSRLAILGEGLPRLGFPKMGFSAPDLFVFERAQKSFEDIGAFQNKQFELSGNGQPERVMAARVSAALFSVLDVQPVLGRIFTPEEDVSGHNVVLLSYGLWQHRYAGDPAILGHPIDLDRHPFIVIGIMPPKFQFPLPGPQLNQNPADLWVPMAYTPAELQGWGMNYNNSVVARLRAGITIEQARAEADALSRVILENYPPALTAVFRGTRLTVSVSLFQKEVVGSVRTLLFVLMAAVGLVLLIACANVATLLISRSASRQKEIAIRTALGATRLRMVRQMLTESLIQASMGGLVGFFLALWAKNVLLSLVPCDVPLPHQVPVDFGVLAFLTVISCLTAVVFGLAPAIQLSTLSPQGPLQEGGRSGSPGRRSHYLQGVFVTAEFALALVLLTGAGLLIRSFQKLSHIDLGFRPDQVLTAKLSLPQEQYSRGGDVRRFYEQLLEELGNLPGVKVAALTTDLPLEGLGSVAIQIEGQGNTEVQTPQAICQTWIAGNYLQGMGIALVQGRSFTVEDRNDSLPVALVSQATARQLWPGQSAIGKRIRWGVYAPWQTIVGIVGDVSDQPLGRPAGLRVYRPYLQLPELFFEGTDFGNVRSMNLVVRTQQEPASLTSAIVGRIHRLDPKLAVADIRKMAQVVGSSVAGPQFNTLLLGVFAGLALILAALGISGVVAYMVTQQRHEIGIRLALGARSIHVLAMLLGRGTRLAAFGMVIGIASALVVTRWMVSLLYGVTPADPMTFGCVVILLFGVGLLACYIPARRATKVDPMVALRYE